MVHSTGPVAAVTAAAAAPAGGAALFNSLPLVSPVVSSDPPVVSCTPAASHPPTSFGGVASFVNAIRTLAMPTHDHCPLPVTTFPHSAAATPEISDSCGTFATDLDVRDGAVDKIFAGRISPSRIVMLESKLWSILVRLAVQFFLTEAVCFMLWLTNINYIQYWSIWVRQGASGD